MKNISVVIPLFNKYNHIERCLDSILNQEFSPIEIIVVDDGSTDGSASFVDEYYPQVRLIKQKNSGVSVARNNGIKAAKSEFIALLDADDFWMPNFLSSIQNLIKNYPQASTFCTHYGFILDGQKKVLAETKDLPNYEGIISDYFASCYNSDLPLTASSICIRRTALEKIGGFPLAMEMGEDQVVWAKLACIAPIAYSSRTCMYYDQTVISSVCHTNLILEPAPQVAIYQEMIDSNEVPPELLFSLKKLIHLSVMSCIKNNLINGMRFNAIQLLLRHPGLLWDKYRLLGFALLLFPKNIISRIYKYARNSRKS